MEIGAFVCFQIIKGTSDQPEGILDRDAIQNGGRGKHDGLLPKRSDEPIHGPYLSRKALGLDFLPQEGNIATPLLPPREHVGGIGIEDTAPLTLTLARLSRHHARSSVELSALLFPVGLRSPFAK